MWSHPAAREVPVLPADATNVLVCLRYGIGDVVMELPVLAALRDALPAARVTALVAPPAHELLQGDPHLDRVVPTSRWALGHRWDAGSAETRARIRRWVGQQGFDLVLDARQAVTAVELALSSSGIPARDALPEEEARVARAGGSGVQAIRSATALGWGLEIPARPARVRPGPEDHAFVERYLAGLGLAGKRPVAVSPVASHDLKRWPPGSLASVADWIVERYGGPVLVLEGPEPAWGGRVVAAMEHREAAIRVGSWHLLRTAALLARCRAFVCNDTGLLHLAAAVGTPTVGVFGPTRARLYLPPGAHTAAVEPPEPSCPHRRTASLFPPECWSRGHCLVDERSCVRHARVEDVRAALARLLGSPSGSPTRPGSGADSADAPRSSAAAPRPGRRRSPRRSGADDALRTTSSPSRTS